MNEKSRDKMCCLPMRKKVANIVTLRFYSRRDNSVEFISSSLTKKYLTGRKFEKLQWSFKILCQIQVK